MTAALDVADLDTCEEVIARGLTTFVEVGQALVRIRDGRLYRADHPTFETYCDARWGLSRSRAYQLIEAAAVSTIVDTQNEAQARELAPLLHKPEEMKRAFDQARENAAGKPTAAAIRQVVRPIAKVTETIKTETVFDTQTGEVVSPEEWATPAEAEIVSLNPLAAARAAVASQPAMVATKAIERLGLACKTFEAAGSVAEIVADLANDEVIDRTGDWLDVLDRTAALVNDLASALRRTNLRSVKP